MIKFIQNIVHLTSDYWSPS